MSVQEVKLGDVAEFIRGINFKPDDVVPLGTEGSVGCMRTKNVQDELDCSDVWAVPKEFVRRKEQMLREGDILVSSANSWNLVGKCSWIPKLEGPSSFGGFVSVLRAEPKKVEPRFLYRWFSWEQTQALLRSFGQKTTNISNLNIERCLNMKLRLPPLPEQHRIVAILDQSDALRTKRRQTLAQLNSLTQSIFIEMFGNPARNEMKWKLANISALGQVLTGGTPSSAKEGMFGDAIPFITPGDLDSGAPPKRSLSKIGAAETPTVRAGATMVCCIGTIGKIGITTTISAFNQQINAIEWGNEIDDKYGLFVMQFFRPTIIAWGTSTTMPILKKSTFEKIEIPVPPLELQRAFSQRVASCELIRQQYETSLNQLDELFKSLQSRAFAGNF